MIADDALQACLTLGLIYRADGHRDGLWTAPCPLCVITTANGARPLTIRESRRGEHVTLYCRNDCEPIKIERHLEQAITPPASEEDWPTLGEHTLPPFPVDALPSDVAAWVRAVSMEAQTPVDLAAMAALGVLSAAGMGAGVVDCEPWEEELALYIAVGMPSGDRKSTVLRSAVAPLRAIERECREEAMPVVRELRDRLGVLEARKRKRTKTAGESLDAKEREEAGNELKLVSEQLEEIGNPVLPRLLADDATPEALGGLLAQHGSIAVVAAESALLDNLVGRYSNGSANLHLICSAYSAEATTIDRRGRDPETIDRPLMTVCLAVQPHVLSALIEHPITRGQGLVARFAYSMPTTALGHRMIDAPKAPVGLHERWAAVVRRIACENPRNGDRSDKSLSSVTSVTVSPDTQITLSPEAVALLQALRAEQEPRLGEDGDLRPMADWAGRHPGRVARIAGLLHLAQHPVAEPIGGATMSDALRIGEYLLDHGLAALRGFDPLTRRALRWLTRHGERIVTERDLQRGVVKRGTAGDTEALAKRLEQLGALRMIPASERKSGRPPSPSYEVHPDLLQHAVGDEA